MAESMNPRPQPAPGVYRETQPVQQPRLTPSQELLRYFAWKHLPDPLKGISQECSYVAKLMERDLPDGPEKTMGLRKLLEAKDCFVRAALPPAPAYPLIPKSDKLAEYDGDVPGRTSIDEGGPHTFHSPFSSGTKKDI